MLLFKATRVLLLDLCLEVFFDHVRRNLIFAPDELERLYKVYLRYVKFSDAYYHVNQKFLSFEAYQECYATFKRMGENYRTGSIFSEEVLNQYMDEIIVDMINEGRQSELP